MPERSVADLDHIDSLGLLARQTRVLELIAAGAPLAEMLTAVTVALEELIPGSRCSILLLDATGATLHHGAAPSLPVGYSAAIDGLVIGDDAGSCGAAAYLGERVVAEDIAVDRRWERFRHLALPRGLHACWSSPILGRGGSPVGTFAVYHPQPHLPSVREQRLAGRAKSEFLSAVSHELRTPLQAITGFTELLGTLDLDPQRRQDALRHIAGAASHILALADDVLDIAKIEARALPLRITCVELAGPLAEQRGVILARGALDGAVRADRRRLRQILINLVTNGVRYHRGDGRVRVEAAPVPGGGQLVRVVDNGPGIPAALLGRLFVPFDRLGRDSVRPGAEPEAGQGAGLGLVLARELTEAMAGRLEVHSVEGAGTTVEVVLPGASVIATAARRARV